MNRLEAYLEKGGLLSFKGNLKGEKSTMSFKFDFLHYCLLLPLLEKITNNKRGRGKLSEFVAMN